MVACTGTCRVYTPLLTSHTRVCACRAEQLLNNMATLCVKMFLDIKQDIGLCGNETQPQKDTMMPEKTEEEWGLACNGQSRQIALERHKQWDERKEESRPFPCGCLASNTILPKLLLRKWNGLSPPLRTIWLIPCKMLAFRPKRETR